MQTKVGQIEKYGQLPCYKCESAARVRTARRCVFGKVFKFYSVCCTNPDCGESTRNYLSWERAVDAWNSKPSICDMYVDRIFDKFDSIFEKKPEKERED